MILPEDRNVFFCPFLQSSLLEICRRWNHFGITEFPNLQLAGTFMPTNYLEKHEKAFFPHSSNHKHKSLTFTKLD